MGRKGILTSLPEALHASFRAFGASYINLDPPFFSKPWIRPCIHTKNKIISVLDNMESKLTVWYTVECHQGSFTYSLLPKRLTRSHQVSALWYLDTTVVSGYQVRHGATKCPHCGIWISCETRSHQVSALWYLDTK